MTPTTKQNPAVNGGSIKCNFDGERMIITERAENVVDDADVPGHTTTSVSQPMADA